MKNVPGPDYQMTYPCFILMNEAYPQTIHVLGERCICLFTDRHLVEQFHFAHRSGSTISSLEFSNRKELIAGLKKMKPAIANEVPRVAVDPTPGLQVQTARIGDFIGMLQRHS
jgi:hypothetical protein